MPITEEQMTDKPDFEAARANLENSGYILHLEQRANKAEHLARILIRVNPMVRNLKPVKEAFAEWAKYVSLHDQLKVYNDHE